MAVWRVPLGEGEVAVNVPAGWRSEIAVPPGHPVLADLDAAIAHALDRPVAGPPLAELAAAAVARAAGDRRRPRVVIAVTDATRECPDDRFLPPMIERLRSGGVADDDITIVVATGLHRASTPAEKTARIGPEHLARHRIVDHDAGSGGSLVDLGRTAAGFPIVVSRLAAEADLLLATGIVEPHQYAGYSGGAKTVAIGLAGEPTIAATHGVAMLDDPRVRLARLDGNPFAAAVAEIGRRLNVAFAINLVPDADGRPVAVAGGEPGATHARLAEVATRIATVPATIPVDIAVAGVGAPKDANLYQASRAVSYLHFAPRPVVRPGGVYVLPATISEGAGEGVGERRCYEALASMRSPAELLDRLRREGTRGGEQRAFIVASVLRDAAIVVVGADRPDVVRACAMHAVATLDEGLALAADLARASLPSGEARRELRLLVVPHAIRTLPVAAA
jgi:nickel-dependent lactate racemase